MSPYLRKVEKEVLIPRYIEYKITNELCREEQRLFAECAKEAGFRVVVDCKHLMRKFEECSNKHWRDDEVRKQVEKEYLEKRKKFRETGEAERTPFKRF